MKKIVVIGATGMLGKPVVSELGRNSFHVIALSRNKIESNNQTLNVEFVRGDLQSPETLDSVLKDAYGLHINLSGEAEAMVEAIVDSAVKNKVKLITYISGITVNQKNADFKPIGIKYKNEQKISSSGINYAIFKPTWFMESLPLFVNNGRAAYFGNHKTFVPFIAAMDYAKMVLRVYKGELEINTSYDVIGDSTLTFEDGLKQYVNIHHQSIKKVSSTPYFIGNLIAKLSGSKQLKDTVAFMKYFEKAEANSGINATLTGETSFAEWLEKNE